MLPVYQYPFATAIVTHVMRDDTRNVTDEFRGVPTSDVKSILDQRRNSLQIAVENLERDFNMGTIIRNANAFNVSVIHVIGRKQWNKRGAMGTDHYMNIQYHPTVDDFVKTVGGNQIIGIDNIDGSVSMGGQKLPSNSILVFGSEGAGLSKEMIGACSKIVAIEQFGSTRSVNVGVASGIAMYAWIQQNVLASE